MRPKSDNALRNMSVCCPVASTVTEYELSRRNSIITGDILMASGRVPTIHAIFFMTAIYTVAGQAPA